MLRQCFSLKVKVVIDMITGARFPSHIYACTNSILSYSYVYQGINVQYFVSFLVYCISVLQKRKSKRSKHSGKNKLLHVHLQQFMKPQLNQRNRLRISQNWLFKMQHKEPASTWRLILWLRRTRNRFTCSPYLKHHSRFQVLRALSLLWELLGFFISIRVTQSKSQHQKWAWETAKAIVLHSIPHTMQTLLNPPSETIQWDL